MAASAYGKIPGTWALPLFLTVTGAAGLFFGLPNPLSHVPFLALLFPFSLYWLAATASGRKNAFLRGWTLGLCGNSAGLYWLIFPMRDVAGMPFFLAVPCALLLFAYLSLFSALGALSLYALRSFFDAPRTRWLRPLLPPLLGGLGYGGFEVLGGWLFTGFPWLCLSTAFAWQPDWIQAASLTGAYGLSALLAAAAFCAAAAFLERGTTRVPPLAAVCAILLMLPAYGMLRLALPEPEEQTTPLSLIMVQGNIDQSLKWDPALQKATLDHYLSLSKKALLAYRPSLAFPPPDLVLWPETSMPFYFQIQHEYAAELRAFAAHNTLYLGFGAPGLIRDPRSTSLLNRFYLLSPSGATAGVYDKEHLVPFGEYTPFTADIPFLRDLLQGMNFTPGLSNDPLPLERSDGERFLLGTLICYEAIFPALAQERTAKGAEILVNISNDGWFRKSSAPLQHLAHAALRCVEQSRPLVRATNTGVTAVLDRYGRITARLDGLFADGVLAATVAPCRNATLYHRLHPAPELLMAALALFPVFGYSLRNMKHRNKHAATA